MAEVDSVPIHINLKLAEYAFQLQDPELSSLHENAKAKLWEGIEKDELTEKNEKELKKIDEKIKDAEDSLGETDVSEGLREKAAYLCRIGEKEKALEAIDVAFEKTAGVGAKIDLVLGKIRLGLFYYDPALVEHNITKANQLIEEGGDWDRRNRLKVHSALQHLTVRRFKEAADLLIDSLSTFTATELMPYEDFVALTVVAASVGCERKDIKSKILGSAEINASMPQLPVLSTFAKSLYETNYSDFFQSLAQVEEMYLLPSPILAPHARYYVREMRIKAYTQILESYRSLTLERMSKAFGVGPAFLDADLSRFIASGRLTCTIDKVSGVITTNKTSSENKTAAYEQVVKQGDVLLNEIQKLSRVIG